MSRRPNPAADRAEQNRQTLKSLVKLESNKSCADCKRNKHPRWASWNLGIFVCIRCSGIHRGMGTHISRVKSVDLDSWTDEQLQSMLRWGNSRANKYWEAKLAPGHVPAEAKIENFIRTKYESKRWVMDGPMPDPATLDVEGDDDVPLNVVQEKAKLERSSSQRAAAAPSQSKPPVRQQPQQNIDLFGDDPEPAPPRPSTTGPSIGRSVPPKAEAAPPKQTRPGDSLLGLDFFGGASSAPPARPSSTTGTTGGPAPPSRPDLKQSILSLYSNAAPKPAPTPQAAHARQDSFGGLQSSGMTSQPSASSGFGGLNDAFSGLSFAATPAQPQPKPSAFADLTSFSSPKASTSTAASSTFGGGGGFFDAIPKSSPKPTSPPATQARTMTQSSGFGDFGSLSPQPAPAAPAASKPAASSGMGDLFDLSMPASNPAPAAPQMSAPISPPMNSVFNLSSAPAKSPAGQPKLQPSAATNFSNISSADAWGSSDAWAATNTATAQPATTAATTTTMGDLGGWGSPPAQKATTPKVSGDEDFGGWSSASNAPSKPTAAPAPAPKPLGGLGGDDLFSNVWE